MHLARWALMMAVLAGLGLSGCSRNNEPKLLNMRNSQQGPDEFSILPNKPLETPQNYSELPAPTLGSANRADATPNADAIVALGGRPGSGGIPAADGALVSQATRYGVSPGIRQTLAAEDLEFRRRNDGRLLERVFSVNVYFRAYRNQSLNQYRELERFRAAGVRTPAVPPAPVEDE